MQHHELDKAPAYSITLPGLNGSPTHRECGQHVQAKLVVYDYNRFVGEGMDMIVLARISFLEQKEDVCKTPLVRSLNHMCWIALLTMCIVLCVCILPEAVVTGHRKLLRRIAKRANKEGKGSR